MKNDGFDISPAYQDVLRNLCKVSLIKCDKGNIDEILNISGDISTEEQKVIDELRTGLFPSDNLFENDKKQNAFSKFISTVICDSVLHSKEREFSTEKTQGEK